MAEGAVNKLTPVDAKRLVNCSAEEIFSFYHPEDLNHVLTFISVIFRIIFNEAIDKRKNYNITIYARIKNAPPKMKVGEYAINQTMTPAQILQVITSGKSAGRPFTVSEGLNMFEIAELYQRQGFGTKTSRELWWKHSQADYLLLQVG